MSSHGRRVFAESFPAALQCVRLRECVRLRAQSQEEPSEVSAHRINTVFDISSCVLGVGSVVGVLRTQFGTRNCTERRSSTFRSGPRHAKSPAVYRIMSL